jgi:glycine/D-amino acid oxidase-like deaminating enzyme
MHVRFAPYWYDRLPASRRPAFPRLRTNLETRVAVIGGGLTGCACAVALASARIPVVLVEAGRIGAGATAAAAGLVRVDFDAPFGDTASAIGLRPARAAWQAMRRSALDLQAVLRRLGIRCDLMRQDLLHAATSGDAAARRIRREHDARKQAGLDVAWVRPGAIRRAAAIESGGAIRTGAAVLDPYRACLGLARAANARGAALYEQTAARRVRSRRAGIEVTTTGGVLRAEWVVIATDAPLADLRALRRHLTPRQTYGVVTAQLPAAIRREVGSRQAVLEDTAEPPHLVRWLRDDRVLVEGGAHDPVPVRLQPQTLVQRTAQLMYELSLLYPAISGTPAGWGWSRTLQETVDGLPYVGTHRNFPRHLFALGVGRHGPGASWLAAKVLLRQLAGEPAKGDEVLGFGRIL